MESYFTATNPLALLHGLTWVVALGAGFLWHRQVRRLRRTSATVRAINESEYKRLAYPVEKFDAVFDFCASAFILIGLAGTILGFIQAVPHLKEAAYDFSHFRAALAVSAFGIAWSIVLHAAVALYRLAVVAPALETLQSRQSAEQLATMLAKALTDVTADIATKLGAGLGSFVVATNRLEAATTALAVSASSAGETFKGASDDLTRSAASIVDLHNEIRGLPASIADRLRETMDQHTVEMRQVFAEQRQDFAKTREVTRGALDQYFEATHERFVQQLEKEVEAAGAATAKGVATIGEWADAFATGLKRVQKRIPEEVHQAHRDALVKVASAGEALAEAEQRRVAFGARLETAGAALEPAIARFSSSARTLGEALSRLDAVQLASLTRKVETFVSREPHAAPPSRRRWFSFVRGGQS